MTLEQIAAIRDAAATWRQGPEALGPKPDGQVRDAIEVLLGTGVRPGEVLALRPVDVSEGSSGMVAHVRGTVVYRRGVGTFRQDQPKTDSSVRRIPVPEFAAEVLRRRLAEMTVDQSEWTIFRSKTSGPITLHNFRRTFRAFLELAALDDSGISPRWYRRTTATVIARAPHTLMIEARGARSRTGRGRHTTGSSRRVEHGAGWLGELARNGAVLD